MFSKANLVSTIVTAIWGMGGGFLLWGIIADPIMSDSMMSGLMKPEPDFFHLAIGCLIQAFGFSSIYGKYGRNDYSAKDGLGMGALVGVMIGAGEKLIDFATSNMINFEGTIMNFVIYMIFFGITGLLVGLVYKKMA
ncbi:MAG: hypothetical protein K0U54_08350 [Bacteroidetes bacterium]|nr:hypothetical protein [Bacteroidota bacterium]